ncbi:MAG: cyclodeaminase/cyclohydrolase family protein [Candidatus Cybelea sp.]
MESLDAYLERLASKEAVPGGGSAAALIGALAAALVAMVGRIGAAPIEGLVSEADGLRAELAEARLRDEAAYAAVIEAQALPKGNDAESSARRRVLDGALEHAAQVPLEAAGLSLKVLRLADRLARIPKSALASDVGCAAEFANAALAACAYNVRVNHRYMRQAPIVREQAAQLVRYEGEASQILGRVRAALSL